MSQLVGKDNFRTSNDGSGQIQTGNPIHQYKKN
jgi:hypothetical protein